VISFFIFGRATFFRTFLKKYGFSSIGYNFLISCLAIQWAMLSNNLLHYIAEPHAFKTIELGIVDLVKADFAAGAVLISFGAVLGKTTPLQMLLVVFFELIFYGINEAIGAGILSAVDMGGSIFVHTFGAFFGLGMSWVISRARFKAGEPVEHFKAGSTKTSDMFAMIGTIFLWMFWPSFNGALATEDQQYRVVINTVIALTASCVIAFVAVVYFSKESKFDMVSIQNATLAGGVAVGSSSDLVIQPFGALIVGLVAGLVSVVGYEKIQPWLARTTGLDDTCGVNNLHGMPGVIGAIGGAISAMTAGTSAYGNSIGAVFPARAPSNATLAAALGVAPGSDRTANAQAGIQMLALIITLTIAIGGGMFTGLIIKMKLFLPGLDSEKANCCGTYCCFCRR
jgi:ammonium transporter Rh